MFKNQNNYFEKYLKYKKKYLDLKKIIGGMEVVNETLIEIEVQSDDQNIRIEVNKDKEIYKSIEEAFKIGDNMSLQVIFGDEPIEPGKTFEDYDIEDGARLGVIIDELSWFFISELKQLNPQLEGMNDEELFKRIFGGDDYINMNLSYLELNELPPSINRFSLNGSLYLTGNNLKRLPEKFNNIRVRGSIFTEQNQWEEGQPNIMQRNIISFEDVKQELLELNPHLRDENIDLSSGHDESIVEVNPNNRLNITNSWDLNSLGINNIPPSIGLLTINGELFMCHNNFTTLPNEFSNIRVRQIRMHDNHSLTHLPNSIDGLQGCEFISLFDCPMLITLPDEFMNINVDIIQIDHTLYAQEENRLNIHFELVNVSYQQNARGQRVPHFVTLKRRN